jgi:hypothetical protein
MKIWSGDKFGAEKLKEFYRIRGIDEKDTSEKRRALECLVRIPGFPYSKKEPSLYELEQQFIQDRVEEKKAENHATTTND